MLQTKTAYQLLSEAPVSLHGLRFRELLSVDETARPPGGGVPPAVVGPIDPSGYALDEAAGTIARAVGLDPIWARVVYEWEDAPTQEEQDAAQAAADLAVERPQLAALLAQAMDDLEQEETRAQAIQDEAAALLTASASDPTLPASPSPAQIRAALVLFDGRIDLLATHTRDAALGAKRNIQRTRRTIRALASLLGIPLPSQGEGFQGGGKR